MGVRKIDVFFPATNLLIHTLFNVDCGLIIEIKILFFFKFRNVGLKSYSLNAVILTGKRQGYWNLTLTMFVHSGYSNYHIYYTVFDPTVERLNKRTQLNLLMRKV